MNCQTVKVGTGQHILQHQRSIVDITQISHSTIIFGARLSVRLDG